MTRMATLKRQCTSISAELQENIAEQLIRIPQICMRPTSAEILILLCSKAVCNAMACWNRFTSAGQVCEFHILREKYS